VRWLALAAIAAACRSAPTAPVVSSVTRVLDAGAEPRQLLHYTFRANRWESFVLEQQLSVSTAASTTTTKTKLVEAPTVRVEGRMGVTAVTVEGDALVALQIGRVQLLEDRELDKPTRAQLTETIAKLEGSRSTWRLSPRGQISDIAHDARRGRDPWHAAQEAQLALVVLPEQPVGVGARWETATSSTIAGVRWERRTFYTLRSLAERDLELVVQVTGTAARQVVRVEPRATMTLEAGKNASAGTVKRSLDKLIGTSVLELSGEEHYSVEGRLRLRFVVAVSGTFTSQPLP
jgi:hypothetical protein